MKEHDDLRRFGEIDDRFVEEATPGGRVRRRRRFVALVAACLSLVLLIPCGVYLFTPFDTTPPDVSDYKNSPYYPIIERLNEYSYVRPAYQNYFELLTDRVENGIDDLFGSGKGTNNAPSEAPSSPGGGNMSNDGVGEYVEVTDNQVAGVIEGDLIKRSSTHIYYLHNSALSVYRIAGEETEQVGRYIPNAGDDEYSKTWNGAWEMYLSADCRTVTLVAPYYSKETESAVQVISLDVSDPASISVTSRFTVTGGYLSSRSVNGKLMLMTEFYAKTDFDDESSFIPQIDMGNGCESIPIDSILFPDELTSRRYTVVCQLDEATLSYEGSAAFLSYSDELYVSAKHIFATRSFASVTPTENEKALHEDMTEISCLSYGTDGFGYRGSVTVKGRVKDQYSMDEYNGMLRVVTSTTQITMNYDKKGQGDYNLHGVITSSSVARESANLYCIDISTWETVGEVIGFAPQGETVESVRFDGEAAYVCTAMVVLLTDPVFFFDLSDPTSITYTDTGTIDGYSSSLVSMGDGFLLGIGVGAKNGSLKIEVYEEDGDRVVSVCSYEIEFCSFSSDYKAYYIDRENGLIGLGVADYSYTADSIYRYILLHFDGYELHELADEPLGGIYDTQRGVYIEDYFYMFGADDCKVIKIFA
ncbi:MAG: beta-propeller domain-containing protein [Clostridia bacterium]|nr:beta-propeller domain-containing protein [Clostridia bacterium]